MDVSGSTLSFPTLDAGWSPCLDSVAVGRVAAPEPVTEIRFRCFRLLPGSRLLLRNGRPLDLGSRAFDLLHVLAASRGSVVDKGEILNRVWPRTTVEESNLRFQVAVLRRALGEDRDLIKTVAGRGYQFSADVAFEQPNAGVPSSVALPSGRPWADDGPRSFAAGRAALDALSLAPSEEACEALRGLLRTVLDELWAMILNAQVTRRESGQRQGAGADCG
ncbi:MAG: winged helix-turn-helix domain-containing protein [Phenylobacterium sp.]